MISWEIDHPERRDWTAYALQLALAWHGDFNLAKDITTIRPDWQSLTVQQRCTVIVQLFAAIAFYESSWNPKCSSVDAGEVDDPLTYSDGLMQVSAADQQWSSDYGYSHEDLLTPKPNLKLAFAIMGQQILNQHRIILNKGIDHCYWSTLSKGYAQNKVDEIIEMVNSLTFEVIQD